MKPKKKQRSSNLELLGGVPSDYLRRIKEIAGAADLPIDRVFRDVLAIGVSVVSDPEESPYQSLISFRHGLAAKQAEIEHVQQSQPESRPRSVTLEGEEQSERAAILELDPGHLTVPAEQETTEDGLGDVALGPGLESESETDSGLFPVDTHSRE